MNRKTIGTIAASAVSAVVIGVFGGMSMSSATAGTATPTPTPSPCCGAQLPAKAGSLTDQEKKDLAFSREEERMARDLYQAFANKYDQARPFSNIVRSEQQHFAATGMLLQRYGLADPSAGKKAGTYADAELQKLYDGWLAQGGKSLAEAYKVGVALEKRDIADLSQQVARTKAADVKQVYGNLLKASEQHLRAYTAATQGRTAGMQGRSGQGRGNGPGRQWQGQQQGPGMQGQGPGRQGQGPGKQGQGQHQGPGMGRRGQGPGGYGRTGERPADCPMVNGTSSS